MNGSEWEQVNLLKTRFLWKIGPRLVPLWCHISVTWTWLRRFLVIVCARNTWLHPQSFSAIHPALRRPFQKKNSCWGASSLPAPSLYVARGLTSNGGQLGKLKEFLFKYCLSDHPKTFRIMLRWAILGELCAKDSDLWHDLDPDMPRPNLSQISKLILRSWEQLVYSDASWRDKHDGGRCILVS